MTALKGFKGLSEYCPVDGDVGKNKCECKSSRLVWKADLVERLRALIRQKRVKLMSTDNKSLEHFDICKKCRHNVRKHTRTICSEQLPRTIALGDLSGSLKELECLLESLE